MVICCLLPVAVLGIFLAFGFTGRSFTFLLFLLCPLSHLFLMRGHGKSEKNHH
ncbi:MAG: DUF2933 domain-containing protein [Candidatus Levybacteria bacterium]|nr:DUF2933 domain-containing protein [Candidatus Levybacteria bacterium]